MISSLDNKTVKNLTKLHQKKYREDSFLICDKKLIDKAYEKKYLSQLIYTNNKPFEFENSIEVSKEVINKISKKDNLDYIGVSKLIKENNNYGNRIIILDQLQDPLNIGRIIESCIHFGFDSLILSKDCADIYNEKCLDNCNGNLYDLNICHADLIDEINELKNHGYKVYATGLSNNTLDFNDINSEEKMAFVLGNEGSGVSKEIMDICNKTIKIDMCNIDSLNVAMAASIIMYKFKI